MKKEELEAIVGADDLGPIETYLHAIAAERKLPKFAIAQCAARFEEAGPALRDVLKRAADGELLSEDDKNLLFRGVYLLGAARDQLACQPLLRLLRHPEDELDELFGDAKTEGMPKILAGVFDGDVEALLSLVTDRSINEYLRHSVLSAATFLTWEGRIERDRMRRFLEQFDDERLADDEDYVWIGWVEAIGLLGLRELAPRVDKAWDEERIPEGTMERSDFTGDLRDAEEKPDDIKRFEKLNMGYIKDVLESLTFFRDPDEERETPILSQTGWGFREPVINPMRNVGRNDPCPCGSGKKFKKCCLAG
ncbi:DUF1186 domain-containing protein [Roseiarcaceae bacterium H3SJ34-1]|uniref:DUF1186 domain-containing protein n=1 Tax=Terripilifer ovatus TaxID=3032367 RepID=UPI003AB9B44A|nr:DUF1186 domain-containing protein [Roseiarcaceae bacterium H3SJ34-1]